jgi:hypothetical protein
MERFLILWLAFFAIAAEAGSVTRETELSWRLPSVSDSFPELTRRDFYYRMKGMARVLVFWVGKENVGGGRISLLGPPHDQGAIWTDGVEVLFGSEPDRIPGGHNRWGYARELAFWERRTGSDKPLLNEVLFEGFMSKSDEGSLSQVENTQRGQEEMLFEGTVSIVRDLEANARLWRYYSAKSDTFRNPENAGNAYVRRMTEQPDIDRYFDNEKRIYRGPYGFITAVRSFVLEALGAKDKNSPLSSIKKRKRGYVHNALLYALAVKKVKLHKNFKLSTGEKFKDVLELGMETTNRKSGNTHSFSLHVGTKGDLRGIPLRVVDKPRWWLKIQLELDRSGNDAGASGR